MPASLTRRSLGVRFRVFGLVAIGAVFASALPGLASAQVIRGTAEPGRTPDCDAGALDVDPAQIQERVIALVPHPVKTRLALMFDRYVVSIQQAANQRKFEYERAWLPWAVSVGQPGDGRGADSARAGGDRTTGAGGRPLCSSSQPGWLLFRAPSPGGKLVVALVAETPTAGIDAAQFASALALVRPPLPAAQASAPIADTRPLRVLGPTFSGALRSLSAALLSEPALSAAPITIRSGTASSATSIAAFRAQMDAAGRAASFRSTVASDAAQFRRLTGWLQQRGYGLETVAILSEDDTAYGQEALVSCSGGGRACPTLLFYPREVSHLRDQYQRDQLPQTAPPAAMDATRALRLNLSVDRRDDDRIQAYSLAQGPLSLEAVLHGIVEKLRARSIAIVVIRATDPLDQLFLSQFLHRTYPQGRLVTLGADRLFPREILNDSQFKGDLAVSSVSLLPRNSDDAGEELDMKYTAPSEYGASVRTAMKELLDDACPGTPCVDETRTYLLAIGDQGYWKVDGKAGELSPGAPPSSGESLPSPRRRSVPHTWAGLCLLASGLMTLHFVALYRASLLASSETMARMAHGPQGDRTMRIAGMGGVVMATMALLLAPIPSLWGFFDGPENAAPWMPWAVAVPVMVGLTAIGALLLAVDLRRRGNWAVVAGWAAGTGLLLAGLTRREWLLGFDQEAWYRYTHFESGLSPLGPLLWVAIGVYWWLSRDLSRLAWRDDRRPRLPRRSPVGDPAAAPLLDLSLVTERADAAIERPRRRAPFVKAVCVLAALGAVTIGSISWEHPIKSLEGWRFEWTYAVALTAFTWAIANCAIDCALVWQETRIVLSALERLPLRRAFTRKHGFSWKPLWSPDGGRFRVLAYGVSRLLEAMHRVHADAEPQSAVDTVEWNALWKKRRAIDELAIGLLAEPRFLGRPLTLRPAADDHQPSSPVEREKELFDDVARLQGQMAEVSGQFLNRLSHEWAARQSGGPRPMHTRLKEEAVSLAYTNWIVNQLSLIRNAIVTMSGLFIFACLSVASYPFRERSGLLMVCVLVFLAIAAVVAYVYAQMHRDATLSRLTATRPDELGLAFWSQFLTFSAAPLVSLLAVQWPQLGRFVAASLEPVFGVLKLPL